MELQCPRTMLIVFVVTITAVLAEFNNTTDITLTARRPKHVFKSKSEWKTKTTRTMNAGNVNTMQKPNSKRFQQRTSRYKGHEKRTRKHKLFSRSSDA